MNICYLSPSYNNPHIKNWTDEFKERGYDVTIITPIGNTITKIKKVKQFVNTLKPDILHAHYASGYGVFGAYTKYHPFIISCWGSDVRVDSKSLFKRQFIRYAIKNADIIHVQDPLMAERVKEIYPHKHILVQPWGVNIDIFKPNKHKSDTTYILCTRDTSPIYDVWTLIRAIPLVLKKIDAKFIFTSEDVNDLIFSPVYTQNGMSLEEIRNVLIKSIERDLPRNSINITGFLASDDYVKLLQSCDLYIDTFYPFDGRGGQAYGQALLEAMACGVPTLVADRPTLHLEPKWYFGDTFKGGNPSDLADKLIELINDKNRQREIIEKNRESVIKYFDWKKNMDIIERELYVGR